MEKEDIEIEKKWIEKQKKKEKERLAEVGGVVKPVVVST